MKKVITWDENKRQANRAKHGFDFADLSYDFFVEARIFPAHQDRFKAVGLFQNTTTLVVVFYVLGREGLSVVSMRQASLKERKLFNAN